MIAMLSSPEVLQSAHVLFLASITAAGAFSEVILPALRRKAGNRLSSKPADEWDAASMIVGHSGY